VVEERERMTSSTEEKKPCPPHDYEIILDSVKTEKIGYRRWERVYPVYCRKCLHVMEIRKETK
jgi:hypothetical protein